MRFRREIVSSASSSSFRALIALVAGVVLPFEAAPLQAQIVRGTVVALADSSPEPGVLVQLVAPTGEIAVQAISNASGAFSLLAPAGGTYRLRGLRIGFRPTIGDPFGVATTGITEHSLELSGSPVLLAPTTITAVERCDSRGDTASLGFRAWEQARTALAALAATRQSSTYELDVVSFKSRRAPRGDAVISYSEIAARTRTSRPFVALPLTRLRDSGYVVRDPAGVHLAQPDEEVLLSDDFGISHCIRALPSQGDSVVLLFEPTRERTLSDVAGQLVLSRQTSELRNLRYKYVNLPREEGEARGRGESDFLRLPSGGWIERRWRITYPMLERRETREQGSGGYEAGASQVVSQTRLTEWQEAGGEVAVVRENGKEIWRAPTTTLYGRVVDDSLGQPMPFADIRTELAPPTVTDAEGHFVLRRVRLGDLVVRVAPTYTAPLGIAPRSVYVRTREDSTAFDVRVPHVRRAVFDACSASGHPLLRDNERSMVRGVVRDRHGDRAGSFEVRIAWNDPLREAGHDRGEVRTRSTATGDFSACGLPIGIPLRVRALAGDAVMAEGTTTIDAREGVVFLDLGPPAS